jgi:hypothetical protein
MPMPRKLRAAVFVHIQKTAGTSVQEMARQAYGNDNVISHGDYEELGLEACKSIPFVSGHFGYAFAKPLMADRYSFTLLRDPVERLLSLHRYYMRESPESSPTARIAHEGDLCYFLDKDHGEVHRSHIWNHQTLQIAHGYGASLAGEPDLWGWELTEEELLRKATSNLGEFDFVGLAEKFDADIEHVFREIGVRRKLKIPCTNTTRAGFAETVLSHQEKCRLRDFTELDSELYAHVQRQRQTATRRWNFVRSSIGALFRSER